MTDDEIIAVVQAHKEGKKIQQKPHGQYWANCCCPLWDFHSSDYRVTPEPRKPREWEVYYNADGSIRSRQYYDRGNHIIRVREVIE